MKYVLEHESVGKTLKTVPTAGAGDAAGGTNVGAGVVFVGWSTRESLLLRPEYACLSLPGVTYFRLPRSLNELRFVASSEQTSFSETVPCAGLATPGGQWAWALDELLKELGGCQRGRPAARLVEMRRFATCHWPGWYEGALNAIGEAITRGRGVAALVDVCRHQAPLVESLEAAAPLVCWNEAEANRHSIELVGEVAAYAAQGMIELQTCRRLISDEPGWRVLRDGCDDAAGHFSKLLESGRAVDARVREWVDEVCRGVRGILESLTLPSPAAAEHVREWAGHAEQISSALQSLVALRDSTRASLMSGT